MPITRVGTVQVAGAAAGTAALTIPTVQDHDLIVVWLHKEATDAVTVPPGQGYAALDAADTNTSGGTSYDTTYYAWLQAGDSGATHTFSFVSTWRAAQAIILRGVDVAAPLAVADPAAGTTGTGTSATTPAEANPGVAGLWALWSMTSWADTTKTFAATHDTYTVTREYGSTTGNLGLARAEYTASAAITAQTVTHGSAPTNWIGKTVAIRPLAGSLPAAARLYLPASGAAAVSPSFSSGWTNTASADRVAFSTTKANTALADKTVTNTTTAGTQVFASRMFVSAPLASQTISGTLRGVVRGLENNAGLNATLAVDARLVDGSGADYGTPKTLLAPAASDDVTTANIEFGTTAATRRFRDANEVLELQLTTQTAAAGDRLVVVVGFRRTGTTGTHTCTLRFGDPTATADFAHSDGLTTDLCPWIEFVSGLTFQSAATAPFPPFPPPVRTYLRL